MKKILIALMILTVSGAAVFAADDAKATEKSAKQYIEDLSSTDEEVVIAAEDWLGQKEEKGAVVKLLDLLKGDARVRVKMYAAVSLGLIGEKTSAEPMSEMLLSEQSADVRYATVLALTRIGIDNKKTVDNLSAAREKENDPFIKDFVTKMGEKFKSK